MRVRFVVLVCAALLTACGSSPSVAEPTPQTIVAQPTVQGVIEPSAAAVAATAVPLPTTPPPPSMAADAAIVDEGDLRSEGRLGDRYKIGLVCPGDTVAVIDRGAVWHKVQVVTNGTNCGEGHAPPGAEGYVAFQNVQLPTRTPRPTEPPRSTRTPRPTREPEPTTAPVATKPPTDVPAPTEAPVAPPTAVPAQPTSAPAATAPPELPAPSFNGCQADPTVAPNYPVKIVRVNKETEAVRLQNVSPDPVDMSGWRMCSIRGNQEHAGVSGTLAPGETKEFPYTGEGNIWSNSEDDPGALYNENGQLVSYWAD